MFWHRGNAAVLSTALPASPSFWVPLMTPIRSLRSSSRAVKPLAFPTSSSTPHSKFNSVSEDACKLTDAYLSTMTTAHTARRTGYWDTPFSSRPIPIASSLLTSTTNSWLVKRSRFSPLVFLVVDSWKAKIISTHILEQRYGSGSLQHATRKSRAPPII